MASHGFILEAPSLVSIYFACTLFVKEKVTSGHLLVYQCLLFTTAYFCSVWVCVVLNHFGYPAPPIGDWRHVKWYNLRLVQQILEEMQQRVTSGLTPLPPLHIASSFGLSAGSTAPPGPSASSSQAHPEVAQKAPHSKEGKAQLAASSQKRGHGGGSKGIRLGDSSASGGAKQRKQSNQPDSSHNCSPQYEDTFEDSDDSNESCCGLQHHWCHFPDIQVTGAECFIPLPLLRYMSRHFIELHRGSFR